MAKRAPAKPTVAPANARAGQGQPRPPAAPKPGGRIKVQATKVCYYDDKRRRIGDVFSISNEQFPAGHARAGQVKEFSSKYMDIVDVRTPERITTGAQILRQEHDVILGQKSQDANADLGRSARPQDQGVEGDEGDEGEGGN